MAKCIYKGEEYRRVSKDEANKLVKKKVGGFVQNQIGNVH